MDVIRKGEEEEIRQIFKAKGFQGKTLEKVVETITSDKELWVKTMLQEEIGLSLSPVSAYKAALITFIAFVVIGFFPLSVYIFQMFLQTNFACPFFWSAIVTALSFFTIGSIKSRYVEKSWYRSGLETMLIGGLAASLAYFVGILLKSVISS